LRIFIEPYVEGLAYQGRNPRFKLKGAVSSSRGFGFAYLALTIAFLFAWFAAPVSGDRDWWQTTIVGLVAAGSLYQVGKLFWTGYRGWKKVDEAWEEVRAAEEHAAVHQSELS
jgi:hypothetical protein